MKLGISGGLLPGPHWAASSPGPAHCYPRAAATSAHLLALLHRLHGHVSVLGTWALPVPCLLRDMGQPATCRSSHIRPGCAWARPSQSLAQVVDRTVIPQRGLNVLLSSCYRGAARGPRQVAPSGGLQPTTRVAAEQLTAHPTAQLRRALPLRPGPSTVCRLC